MKDLLDHLHIWSQYMISISKNMHIDKVANIANIYNNTNHSTIKMKPVDLKSSKSIDFGIENNDGVLGNFVRILKYKTIFPKG